MPCGARRAGRNNRRQAAPVPFPNAGALSADRNPYADAAAPYKVDHVQASGKFPEPLLNTPKTVTVLSKEVLADENATTLKQAVLNTAGVTLGTGEGGNAFGDRFFIRGFDTRNDIFIDGVRDSGVSVRENFFTEQIEILRGPGSSFAGRGTTGGAINIVTKQATTEKSFYNMDDDVLDRSGRARHARRQSGDQSDLGDPRRRRVPGLQRRRPKLYDRRSRWWLRRHDMQTGRCGEGHRELRSHRHPRIAGLRRAVFSAGIRPNAKPVGIYDTRPAGPRPDFGVNRNNFYGFVNRDFFEVHQDIANHQHRSPGHARSDPQRQGAGLAVDC